MTDVTLSLTAFNGLQSDDAGTLTATFQTSAGELTCSLYQAATFFRQDPESPIFSALADAVDNNSEATRQMDEEFRLSIAEQSAPTPK